jgi:hypothetical protein
MTTTTSKGAGGRVAHQRFEAAAIGELARLRGESVVDVRLDRPDERPAHARDELGQQPQLRSDRVALALPDAADAWVADGAH